MDKTPQQVGIYREESNKKPLYNKTIYNSLCCTIREDK